jgi:hypothetical protein
VVGGDVAFSHDQIRHGPPPGIAVDRAANRDTQAALARVLDDGGTVLLSHLRPPS